MRKKRHGELKPREGDKDGLTIRAQRAHFTHTEFKADEVFACCGGVREKSEGGEKKTLISFGSLRLHLTPSIKKGKKRGAYTATKSIQTQRERRQR